MEKYRKDIGYDDKALKSSMNNSLFLEIADGQVQAFENFFHLYKEKLFATVFKMTRSKIVAEEIVQEIFMEIWQRKESLNKVVSMDAYLFSIVYHKIYRHYKQLSKEKNSHKYIEIDQKQSEHTTEEMVLAEENTRLITSAIEKLPEKQRLIFSLSRLYGYSREEIAYKLNISPNTVRNQLAEASKAMKNHLTDVLPFLLVMLLCR